MRSGVDATPAGAPEADRHGGAATGDPIAWMRWVPAVGVLATLLWLLYVFGRVALIPLLASFAIAYLLHPIACRLQARGLSRSVAALVSMVVVGGALVALFVFVLPGLWRETMDAGREVASALSPENVDRLRGRLATVSPTLDRLAGTRLEAITRDPSSVVAGVSWWLAGAFTGVVSGAVASLDFLLVPFFVYYILIDFPEWRRRLEELIPPRFQRSFHPLFDEIGRILETYVTGQLLVAIGMAVLYGLGFWLLDVPAWAGIAVIAGLLNAVPYIGTIIGLLLALAFTLADGGGILRLGGVIAVFVMVQNVEGFYLTPRIIGGRLRLHPMAVFLGILVGGNLFGLLGILVAIPTIAVAKVFAKFVRELYVQSNFYRGADGSPVSAEIRLSQATASVLRDQRHASSGQELLAPKDDATPAVSHPLE